MGNQPLSRVSKSNQGPLPDLLNVRELDGEWDPQKRPRHSFDSTFSGSAPSMMVYGEVDHVDRLASLRRKLAPSQASSTSRQVQPVFSPTGSTLRLPGRTSQSSSQLSSSSSSVRKRVDFDLDKAKSLKVKSPQKPPRKNLPAVYQQQARINGHCSSSGHSSYGGSSDALDDLDNARCRSGLDLQTSDDGQGRMHGNRAEAYAREERNEEPVTAEWETSRIHQDIDSLFSYLNGWPDVDPEEGYDSGCQSPVVLRDGPNSTQAWRPGPNPTATTNGTHSSWPENHMPPLAEDEEDLDEGLGTSGYSPQRQDSSSDGEHHSPTKVLRPAPKPPLTKVQSNVSSSDEGFLDRAGDYEENRSCSRTINSTASSAFKQRAAMLESLLQHRLPAQRQTHIQSLPQRHMTKELNDADVRQVQPRENNDDYGHIYYVGPESKVSFTEPNEKENIVPTNITRNSGTIERRKKTAANGPNHITRSQSCLVSPKVNGNSLTKNEQHSLMKKAVQGLISNVPNGQHGAKGQIEGSTGLQEAQIVMARYTLSSLMPGTVSFRKGQAGVLLRRHSNGWSYVALHNGQGWTPTTYWRPLSQQQPNGVDHRVLPGCPYYYGDLNRMDCQFLMLAFGRDGDYLLRQSSVREGELTLSMRHDANVHHFAVRQVMDQKEKGSSSYVIGNLSFHFDTIAVIVQHFEQHTILSQTFAVLKEPFRLRFI